MALTAHDVTAGEATEVFITLRRYLPCRERLGRGGVSREVAAAGTQTSVRQPSGRPPGSSPLRGEHRDAQDLTCGTNASAERPCLAPLDATTQPLRYPAR